MLCTTSTLAVGVNLPARLVVIKGTRRWSGDNSVNGYQEYDRSTCLQMMGRAGRPQFDTHGIAIIMTQSQVVIAEVEAMNCNLWELGITIVIKKNLIIRMLEVSALHAKIQHCGCL